jgi:hypothetical protein
MVTTTGGLITRKGRGLWWSTGMVRGRWVEVELVITETETRYQKAIECKMFLRLILNIVKKPYPI